MNRQTERKREYDALPPFPCDCCGLCCQHLTGVALYADLDDGTGVCIHYDRQTRLCKIYENRPAKCNIRAGYDWFRDQMTYAEYCQMNLEACKRLKLEEQIKSLEARN